MSRFHEIGLTYIAVTKSRAMEAAKANVWDLRFFREVTGSEASPLEGHASSLDKVLNKSEMKLLREWWGKFKAKKFRPIVDEKYKAVRLSYISWFNGLMAPLNPTIDEQIL